MYTRDEIGPIFLHKPTPTLVMSSVVFSAPRLQAMHFINCVSRTSVADMSMDVSEEG